MKGSSVNVSIYSAAVLMADPLTFTSLAAVAGYSLTLLAVQRRTGEAATLAFAPLFTTTWKYGRLAQLGAAHGCLEEYKLGPSALTS